LSREIFITHKNIFYLEANLVGGGLYTLLALSFEGSFFAKGRRFDNCLPRRQAAIPQHVSRGTLSGALFFVSPLSAQASSSS